MNYFAVILFWSIFLTGCHVNKQASRESITTANQAPAKNHSQVNLKVEYDVPTVGINEYTLIADNVEAHRKDAEAIMRIKKDVPRAMQTKDAALFDRVLAKRFTFRASYEFFNRDDYIRDRVNSPVTVDTAQYENLVLQFFGDAAVSTCRNIVKGNDDKGQPETWRYTWAQVFVKEDGEWKIGALHEIDGRKE